MPPDIKFVDLAPGTVELGWRFDDILPREATSAIAEFFADFDFRAEYEGLTKFTRHQEPTPLGLWPNGDIYAVEVVAGYLKGGDGGCSVHGGEPWPMPWLSVSPSYRVSADQCDDCLPEFFEKALLRPVKLTPERRT